MAFNRIYCGYAGDLNIRNGKTSSAVLDIVDLWQASLRAGKPRTIFSNIKLMGIPYEQFTPESIGEVLETENAIVLLDELHSIVHKRHTVHEKCTMHSIEGLCYRLSEFLRQSGKRHIDTYSTCQTLDDAQYQMRVMMNVQIYCELGHINNGYWKKCEPLEYPEQECPPWHEHRVRQRVRPTRKPWMHTDKDITKVFNMYDSWEIVKGWIQVSDEPENKREKVGYQKEPIVAKSIKGW